MEMWLEKEIKTRCSNEMINKIVSGLLTVTRVWEDRKQLVRQKHTYNWE